MTFGMFCCCVTLSQVLLYSLFANSSDELKFIGHQTFSNSPRSLPITSISSGGANSYASQVTTGVVSKFSVGGGDCVRHSRPGRCQGLSSARLPYRMDHTR